MSSVRTGRRAGVRRNLGGVLGGVLVALVAVAGALAAHDTWLLPTSFYASSGDTVSLYLTSGMTFPANEGAIRADRIREAAVRLAGRTTAITSRSPAESALVLRSRLGEPGTATLWVSLLPRTLDLTEAQVDEYLDEIGAGPAVREAWARTPAPRHWRETYVKHAKTFVRVMGPRDSSWAAPVGLALEIVPETDPTALRAGDTLRVRILRGGAPAAGVGIGLVIEGGPPSLLTADAEGRAALVLSRQGRSLVRATDLRPPREAGGTWESDFTTLTLVVGSPRC